MFYDEAGRMIWSEDAEDNRTYYYYDTAGMNTKIVSPFGNGSTSAVKMYYDKNGNLTSQLTQSNAVGEAEAYDRADYAYNNMNRLTVATSYPTADAPQYTQYFYDVNGNTSHMVTGLTATISAVADAPETSAVHTYAYDRFNRLTSQTNPLGGTESYTYDRSDNMLTKTDENGTKLTYTYNADSNITSIATTNAAEGVTSSSTSISYNLLGLPSSKTVDGTTTSYTYDDFGRMLSETSGDIIKNYTYNDDSTHASFVLSKDGNNVINQTYNYNNIGQLTSVYASGNKIADYTYNANGNILTKASGGLTTTYSYNNANLLTNLTNKSSDTELSKYDYTYYLNGNQATKTDSLYGTTSFVYDGMGRLSSETARDYSANYSYDAFNNRLSQTSVKDGITTTTNYTYDLNNRLIYQAQNQDNNIAETEYYYDNAGNLISKIKGYYTSDSDEEQSIELTDDVARSAIRDVPIFAHFD